MNREIIYELNYAVEHGRAVSAETAMAILQSSDEELPEIFKAAYEMNRRTFGNRAILCSIVSAKSGHCSENCAFCAQSSRSIDQGVVYPLYNSEKILDFRKQITDYPVAFFSIVTSGRAATRSEVDAICECIEQTRGDETGPRWCASLGCLDRDSLKRLYDAGVVRYHHNLEACERFFPEICTSHTFADRVGTIRAAKEVGMVVCSGGIFGVGETLEDRVDLIMTLAREGVDSLPLNFLVPIEGSPLGKVQPLRPLEILRIIAMTRMTNPTAEVRVCGGRAHLRSLAPMIYQAGACGMMVGDLLTVKGGDLDDDLQMVEDLGLVPQMEVERGP